MVRTGGGLFPTVDFDNDDDDDKIIRIILFYIYLAEGKRAGKP